MTDQELQKYPPIMKPEQVAELLGKSVWTIYDLAKRGKLPGAKKIGGSLLINRDILLRSFEG